MILLVACLIFLIPIYHQQINYHLINNIDKLHAQICYNLAKLAYENLFNYIILFPAIYNTIYLNLNNIT